jgi:hypothetical protein
VPRRMHAAFEIGGKPPIYAVNRLLASLNH